MCLSINTLEHRRDIQDHYEPKTTILPKKVYKILYIEPARKNTCSTPYQCVIIHFKNRKAILKESAMLSCYRKGWDIAINENINLHEDYVSFEIAKFLKEKGFDEPCHAMYHNGDDKIFFGLDVDSYYNTVLNADCYACPTLQMAMKWLREVHKIHIVIYPYGDYSCDNYQFDIYKDNRLVVSKDDGYITYEEAVEAAIKYCLENLI